MKKQINNRTLKTARPANHPKVEVKPIPKDTEDKAAQENGQEDASPGKAGAKQIRRTFFEPSQPLWGPAVRPEATEVIVEQEAHEVVSAALDAEDTVHPAAALFPMLDDDEMVVLVQDIKDHGLLHPIVRYQGQILDGRNRLRACERAGVEPKFVEYTGDSPVAYVMAANVNRRHMEKSQLAALAVEMAPKLAEEAKKRQQGGVSLKVGEGGKTLGKAAKEVHVSRSLAERAKKVKAASPDKFAEVLSGKKTVSRAEREITSEVEANSSEPNNEVAPPTPDTREAVEINESDDTTELENGFEEDAKPTTYQVTDLIVTGLTSTQSTRVIELLQELGIDATRYQVLTPQGGTNHLTATMREKLALYLGDEVEQENLMEVTHE